MRRNAALRAALLIAAPSLGAGHSGTIGELWTWTAGLSAGDSQALEAAAVVIRDRDTPAREERTRRSRPTC